LDCSALFPRRSLIPVEARGNWQSVTVERITFQIGVCWDSKQNGPLRPEDRCALGTRRESARRGWRRLIGLCGTGCPVQWAAQTRMQPRRSRRTRTTRTRCGGYWSGQTGHRPTASKARGTAIPIILKVCWAPRSPDGCVDRAMAIDLSPCGFSDFVCRHTVSQVQGTMGWALAQKAPRGNEAPKADNRHRVSRGPWPAAPWQ